MRLKMRICSKQIELIDLEDNKKIAESMFTFRIPSIIFKHAEHAQIYFHIWIYINIHLTKAIDLNI